MSARTDKLEKLRWDAECAQRREDTYDREEAERQYRLQMHGEVPCPWCGDFTLLEALNVTEDSDEKVCPACVKSEHERVEAEANDGRYFGIDFER